MEIYEINKYLQDNQKHVFIFGETDLEDSNKIWFRGSFVHEEKGEMSAATEAKRQDITEELLDELIEGHEKDYIKKTTKKPKKAAKKTTKKTTKKKLDK